MSKIEKAFELFDTFNRQDPHIIVWDGLEYPAEYFYALQLHKWVKKLEPHADEALLLASRSQHIGRWKIPRDQYPTGKAGYYKWRTDLAIFHANTAAQLLSEAGYSAEEVEAVQNIILKKNLKRNDEVQVMENALCLVFLEFQYESFITKHDDEMVVRILHKTWTKMSQPGRDAALTLAFDEKGKALLMEALNK